MLSYLEDGYEKPFDCSIIQYYTIKCNLKYGQSFVHQNNLLRDIFVLTSTMRLHFCISEGDRQVSHGDIIIVMRVFLYLFYHC